MTDFTVDSALVYSSMEFRPVGGMNLSRIAITDGV